MNKLLLIAIITSFLTCNAQAQLNSYAYHSNLEKKVIENYISQKSVDHVTLHFIADEKITVSDASRYTELYNEILNKAKAKLSKVNSDERFLSWLFYKIQRGTLKNYKQYSSLGDVFENGNYDCLSGTALYASLLDELNFDNEIIETNYHVYLLVQTEQGKFLIESTDPLNGFVFSKKEIDLRLADYTVKNKSEAKGSYLLADMNASVNQNKLTGLEYYNKAIVNFNEHKFIASLELLEKSTIFYFSDRTTEFGQVLARALYNDETLDSETKYSAISKVSQLISSTHESVASR